MCTLHLRTRCQLAIKPSKVHGHGLFAENWSKSNHAVIFEPGTPIAVYGGEVVSSKQLQSRYGKYTAPFALTTGSGLIEDGACLRRAGAFANHGSSIKSNAYLGTDSITGRGLIVAMKRIRNGDEILVDYGGEYRFNEPTHWSTSPIGRF